MNRGKAQNPNFSPQNSHIHITTAIICDFLQIPQKRILTQFLNVLFPNREQTRNTTVCDCSQNSLKKYLLVYLLNLFSPDEESLLGNNQKPKKITDPLYNTRLFVIFLEVPQIFIFNFNFFFNRTTDPNRGRGWAGPTTTSTWTCQGPTCAGSTKTGITIL